jgi:hypothetical protein
MLRVYYHGDDDSDAVITGRATIGSLPATDTMSWHRSWKLGNSVATSGSTQFGMDNKRYWSARVNFLGADRVTAGGAAGDSTLKVQVTVTDADGCTGCVSHVGTGTPTATITAPPIINAASMDLNRARLAATLTIRQVWMGPFGSDANSGLNESAPKATFPGAMTALAAGTHDVSIINMLPGTYYTMRTDSLTIPVDTYNTLPGTGPRPYSKVVGKGTVILSGADTTGLDGANWVGKDMGGGVIAYCRAFGTAIWPRGMVLDDSLRIYPYQTHRKLRTDTLGFVPAFGAFWVTNDGDSVFLRPPLSVVNTPVAGHTLNQDAGRSVICRVPRKNGAIRLGSAFWCVDSITFRDFGTSRNDLSITHSVVNISNQGNVIQNCRFEDLNRPPVGIRIYGDQTSRRTGWSVIQKNWFINHTFGMAWDGNNTGKFLGYDKMEPLGCNNPIDTACFEANIVFPQIVIECGRGHVIRYNAVRGGPDSFVRCTNDAVDSNGFRIGEFDVYQNDVMNLGDDNIEPDGCEGTNAAVWKNRLLGGHTASNKEVFRGPYYFMFNTCINQSNGILPFGPIPGLDQERGIELYYNNTFATRRSDATGVWVTGQDGGPNAYVNKTFVNNICNSKLFTMNDEGCLGLNDWNWNYHSITGNGDTTFSTLTKYSATRAQSTLQAWRDSTYGYGKNDSRGTLQFADSANWNWSPKSTWTAILPYGSHKSNARTIPGVNTNISFANSAWTINTSNSSDSTYVGAWKVNGTALESGSRKKSWFHRMLHFN